MLEFQIPIHFEDVSLVSNDKYTVKKIIDISSQNENTILSNLDLIYERIKKDSNDIVDHQCFDLLFSYILGIGKLTSDQRNQIIKILKHGITGLTALISKELNSNVGNGKNRDLNKRGQNDDEDEDIIEEDNNSSQNNKSKYLLYRNSIKMYIFFLEHYISYQHTISTSNSSTTTSESSQSATTESGKKKTTAAASKKKTTKSTISSKVLDNWEQDEQKESILTIIVNMLELNLSTIWRLDYPEEEFINLISKIVYTMIEQPNNLRSNNSSKGGVKKLLFQILSILIINYNHSFNFTSKIIHLLHNHESLASHFADLYEFIQKYQQNQTKKLRQQQKQQQNNNYSQPIQQKNQTTFLISDIIREIGKQKDQRDTSGFKNLAKFLSELTERLPKIVLPFVSLLLVHLDSDNYLMRNAVTESIGYLIGKALNEDSEPAGENTESGAESENEKEEENLKKKESDKTDLLNILFERFRDVNGYCRSSVLKTMSLLVSKNWIPRDHYLPLTKIAFERVSDKNSQVRKRAILLLSDLLENNPYSPHLPMILFKEKKEKLDSYIKLSIYNLKKRKEKELKNNEDGTNNSSLGSQQVPDDNDDDEMDDNGIRSSKDHSNNNNNEEEIEIETKEIFEDIKLNKEQFFDLISMLEPFSRIKEFSPHRLPFMLEHLNNYLESTIKFIEIINGTIDSMSQLMGSVNPTDTLESIHFIEVCHKFQIDKSKEAISKMLSLIWNKEQSIKDSTIRAFNELLIKDTREKIKSTLKSSYYIAKNLIDLTTTATLGEITSLEELMIEFMKKEFIDHDVINALWDIFAGKVVNFNRQDSRGALIILSMISNNNSSIVKDKINLLVSVGLEQEDDYLPRYTCITLQKLRSKTKSNEEILPRFKNNQSLFERLVYHICNPVSTNNNSNSKWFMFAEQAINTIYILAEQPDLISSQIIKKLSDQIIIEQQQQQQQDGDGDNTNAESDSLTLSRLIFILGHIAIKQLVYVEEIQSEIKRIKYELSKQKKLPNEKKDVKGSKSKKDGKDDDGKSSIEKELGTDQAEEEAETEALQNQAETDILSENNLIGKYSSLVISICCNHNNLFSDESLQASAVLTLSKFMCVDPIFCENNLQLLFTLLETSSIEVIRSNIIIGLGDLAFRFPNLVEPWTSKIYSRLRDPDSKARKNSLMVLTHLILNDMIKVKGQISEMAICLEDQDVRISNIAKLFFSTLASKGNNLYNSLPDIIGKLTPSNTTATATGGASIITISKESIKNILKYLFSFIEKEKQSETLVDKLLQRFKISKSIYESQNISFCLQLLNYNDKGLKKLLEHFKLYQDKLNDNEVYNNIITAISKTKKQQNLSKTNDIKQLVDELEKKINQVRNQLDPNDIIEVQSTNNDNGDGVSTQKPQPAKPSKKAPAKKKPAATSKRSSKKNVYSSEEEESESESESEVDESDDDDDDDKMVITPKKPVSKPLTKRISKPLAKNKINSSSSSRSASEKSESESESDDDNDDDKMVITPKKPISKPLAKRTSKPLAKNRINSSSSSRSASEKSESESEKSASDDNDDDAMDITPIKPKRSAVSKKPPPSKSKKLAASRLKKKVQSSSEESEESSIDISD